MKLFSWIRLGRKANTHLTGQSFQPAGPSRIAVTPQTPLIETASEASLASVAYAGGHGVSGGRLGLSLLYYTLSYGLHARTAVCLGTGGGLVPLLMRRAQRDLGLVGARTYLVDALLPEAGYGGPETAGGWFHRRAEFQTLEQDIWLLEMLTADAATCFFGRLGRRIDLLHIDADHSYPGVRGDFDRFVPLLAPHAVVTLHDLRMPSVARLVDEIEAAGDWSVLRFADIGQGLAIVRRRQDVLPQVLIGRYNITLPDGTVNETEPQPPPESRPLWDYLTAPALFARHAIAALWLGRADFVLEIGGYVTPIGPYLREVPHDYVLIDPLCEPRQAEELSGRPCRVRHIPADLDSLDMSMLKDRDYAVVFLGAQLDVGSKSFAEFVATVERYLRIVSGARRAVIEFPPAWTSCRELFDVLLSILKPRIEFEVTLDLSQNPISIADGPVPPERLIRRLFVLSGFAALPASVEARHTVARLLRGSAGARLLSVEDMLPLPAATEGIAWAPTQSNASVIPSRKGTLIITPPQPWAYAASLPLRIDAIAPGSFVVDLKAEEVDGVVYATMATPDLSVIGEQRRFVPDKEGRARLQLDETTESGRRVVLLRSGERPESGRLRLLTATVRQ